MAQLRTTATLHHSPTEMSSSIMNVASHNVFRTMYSVRMGKTIKEGRIPYNERISEKPPPKESKEARRDQKPLQEVMVSLTFLVEDLCIEYTAVEAAWRRYGQIKRVVGAEEGTHFGASITPNNVRSALRPSGIGSTCVGRQFSPIHNLWQIPYDTERSRKVSFTAVRARSARLQMTRSRLCDFERAKFVVRW